jgi:co-chaperonin GroES (HSP10)
VLADAITHTERQMKLTAIGEKVVVKPAAAETNAAGIEIPLGANFKQRMGEVLSIGRDSHGSFSVAGVLLGDIVYFIAGSGAPIEVDGERFLVLDAKEILAKR